MAAVRHVVVGGVGASLSLDDIARVARGEEVVIDTAAAERIKKESPAPSKAAPSVPTPSNEPSEVPTLTGEVPVTDAGTTVSLSGEQTRAAVLARLMSLVNGHSKVRLPVLQLLARCLAASAKPPTLSAATSDAEVLADLVKCLQTPAQNPTASPTSDQPASLGPLSPAEEAVLASGLTSDEQGSFFAGQPITAGLGALAVRDSQQLLAAAVTIAALSAEALQAQTAAFEPEAAEAAPYKLAVAAAAEVVGILEGTGRANPKKGGAGSLPELNAVPQVHGAASEAFAAAYTALRAELASAVLPPGKAASAQVLSPLLAQALVGAARALLAVARLSTARMLRISAEIPLGTVIEAVGAQAASSVAAARSAVAAATAALDDTPLGTPLPGVSAALAAAAAVTAAHQTLALEALAAVTLLRQQEGVPTSIPVAELAPDAGGKGKKKAKGGGGGFVLGRGTTLLRSFLEAAAVRESGTDQDGLESLAARVAALTVEDASTGGTAAKLQSAYGGVSEALNPAGSALGLHLLLLRSIVEANQVRRKPKIAKGARDLLPDQMRIREVAFAKITACFGRHGAVAIDTPVFELRETLTGKYGEDSKLIFDLADQGGESLSLRYDLTVPFARYVALNGVSNIKRYHIAKVYRRDNPQMNRGRFREFYQCDFDIAGSYPCMVPDAEVIKVVSEILTDLGIGKFTLKLNHRRLLDAMLDLAGVPPQKFRAICSAIDKLDKAPWEEVRAEMVDEKGLPGPVADKIGEYVVFKGEPLALLEKLSAPGFALNAHPDAKAALEELKLLFGFLGAMGALGTVSFDLSLARGLDYYTGVIYEAVLEGANVGSIAAGGRYDKLVGMFSGKDVPAVGVSIGIERVFAILESQMRAAAAASGGFIRSTATDVLVASIGNGLQTERMRVASQLWAAGVKAEFGFKPNPKMGDQLKYAFESGIRFLVLFGESEIAAGTVKLKDLDAKEEETIPLAEIAGAVLRKLAASGESGIVASGRAAE